MRPRKAIAPDRLTALYRSYGPAIYSRCWSLLADAGAAEDATQETFLRVWRRLDRVPDAQEALYWIYRVASNYCLNELRDRRVRGIPIPPAELPEIPEASGAVEARIEKRDLARHLIEHAHAKVRVVAWLYHVDREPRGLWQQLKLRRAGWPGSGRPPVASAR